eukprot:1621643-Rhodomonas_salina.1
MPQPFVSARRCAALCWCCTEWCCCSDLHRARVQVPAMIRYSVPPPRLRAASRVVCTTTTATFTASTSSIDVTASVNLSVRKRPSTGVSVPKASLVLVFRKLLPSRPVQSWLTRLVARRLTSSQARPTVTGLPNRERVGSNWFEKTLNDLQTEINEIETPADSCQRTALGCAKCSSRLVA